MSGERGGLVAAVRRLLGLGKGDRRSDPGRPSVPAVPVPPPPPGTGQVPQLRWYRDRPIRPSRDRVQAPLPNVRQRVLMLLAAASVGTLVIVFGTRGMAPRAAPREIRGLWRTEAEGYRGRHFEIRSRRVAFQTGDSGEVGIYEIARVWRSRTGDSTAVRLELHETGLPLELSFVYLEGPPELIRFSNQRALVWTRAPAGRTIMPGF